MKFSMAQLVWLCLFAALQPADSASILSKAGDAKLSRPSALMCETEYKVLSMLKSMKETGHLRALGRGSDAKRNRCLLR